MRNVIDFIGKRDGQFSPIAKNIRLRIILFIFFLSLGAEIGISKPLLISGSPIWNKNNDIIIGNCARDPNAPETEANGFIFLNDKYSEVLDITYAGSPNSKVFIDLEGYQAFKHNNQSSIETAFILSNPGFSKPGVLYQLEPKTQKEINHYVLPFNIAEGSLVQSDVFYKDQWRTFLALTAKDANCQEWVMLIFDITTRKMPLKPLINYRSEELSAVTAKPLFLRLKNGQFAMALGGHLQGEAVLQFLRLNDLESIACFKLNGKAIASLLAVDIYQQAVVNRIYVCDKEHLWGIDLTEFNQPKVRLLANFKVLNGLVVFPNTPVEGLRLYFLGQDQHAQGLFMLQDPLSSEALRKDPELVKKGDFSALFVRFGQLWVISKQSPKTPLVFSLPSHLPVAIHLQAFYPYLDVKEEIVVSKLLWDPKEQTEVLLTMNLSCQLNVFALRGSKTPYGRIMWRKRRQIE